MNKRLTLGLTVLALTSTSLASTWNAYDHMLYQLQRQGYEETVRSVNGYLPEGQEAQWTFRGLAGDAYAAFAVCDEDCSGLSVEVYDQQGRLVDSDSGTETPLATFDVGAPRPIPWWSKCSSVPTPPALIGWALPTMTANLTRSPEPHRCLQAASV